MSFETSWQCGDCKNLFYGIKMYANLDKEHAEQLGHWIYKHSHCENQYAENYVIHRRPENTQEWLGAPLDYAEVLERETGL